MLKTLNMKRYKVHQIVFAVTCVQVLRILVPPSTFVEARTREDLTLRRHFFSNLGAQVLGASSTAAIESTGPTFRTQRTVPEIPVATAVILLRTTQEAALDWGGPFSKPGLYQTNFNKKRSEGLEWSCDEHARRKMTNLRKSIGRLKCIVETCWDTIRPVEIRWPLKLPWLWINTPWVAANDFSFFSVLCSTNKSPTATALQGFAAFKERYANYDLSGLLNQTQLLAKDPRTNRFYFSFLNEVQFRTLQDGIKRRGEQERFGFNVGTRLYRKILEGDTVGPRIIQGDTYDPKAPVNMSSPLSGLWPPLQPPLPKGALASDLSEGSQRLMDYLRREGYCKADGCKLQSVVRLYNLLKWKVIFVLIFFWHRLGWSAKCSNKSSANQYLFFFRAFMKII